MNKRLLGLVALILMYGMFGCSGGPRVTLAECTDGPCGDVRLMVYGAKSSRALSPHGLVKIYRVSISGPGIDGELIADFPGDADEGVIENVPAGDDRLIAVRALNAQDLKFREGEAGSVQIQGGSTADVDITLEPVPIFIDLRDSSIIENTRLIFRIYSESTSPAVIDDAFNSTSTMIVDAATSSPEISPDSATGLGRMAPAMLEPGMHVFTVRDATTGRFNAVNVRLLDGSKREPASLFAGSDVGKSSVFPIRRFGHVLSGQTLKAGVCFADGEER